MLLSKWDLICDHAITLLLYEDFVEGVDNFWLQVQKTIWPGKFPELEAAIKNLSNRASAYVHYFMSNAIYRGDKFYAENKTWSKYWTNKYDEYLAKSKKWQDKSTKLLFNLVVALNEFAQKVRRYMNNNFFIYEGKFIVIDSLGVTSEMESSIYTPESYIDID